MDRRPLLAQLNIDATDAKSLRKLMVGLAYGLLNGGDDQTKQELKVLSLKEWKARCQLHDALKRDSKDCELALAAISVFVEARDGTDQEVLEAARILNAVGPALLFLNPSEVSVDYYNEYLTAWEKANEDVDLRRASSLAPAIRRQREQQGKSQVPQPAAKPPTKKAAPKNAQSAQAEQGNAREKRTPRAPRYPLTNNDNAQDDEYIESDEDHPEDDKDKGKGRGKGTDSRKRGAPPTDSESDDDSKPDGGNGGTHPTRRQNKKRPAKRPNTGPAIRPAGNNGVLPQPSASAPWEEGVMVVHQSPRRQDARQRTFLDPYDPPSDLDAEEPELPVPEEPSAGNENATQTPTRPIPEASGPKNMSWWSEMERDELFECVKAECSKRGGSWKRMEWKDIGVQ